jgi:molybdopterin/thiamine biosynthesis adenylyltransferase
MHQDRKPPFDTEGFDRYARQMILPGIGAEGQEKLKTSRVLVAGVGGLGSLSSLYLCAAGIGHLTIVDRGCVQPPDLNRQILYDEKDIGERKVVAAGKRLQGLNSKIEIAPILKEIKEETVSELLRDIQIVVDGTDNFRTRLILNKACHSKRIPFVYGGIFGLKGSATTIIPGQTPCLECFLTRDEETRLPIPAIGPVVGMIATIQVMEVLKLILQLGDLLAGELALFDGGRMSFRKLTIKKREDCPVCSG